MKAFLVILVIEGFLLGCESKQLEGITVSCDDDNTTSASLICKCLAIDTDAKRLTDLPYKLECTDLDTAIIRIDELTLPETKQKDLYFRDIVITDGSIDVITSDILPDDCKYVEFLDLSRNGITGINVKAFDCFSKLTKLNLDRNKLRKFPRGSLKGLEYLVEMDLSSNGIEVIGKHEFSSLMSIEKLYLSSNKIHQIHSEAFRSCSQLTVLDLSYNRLTHLQDNMFNLEHHYLRELNLRGNAFQYVPTSQLRLLTSLTRLTLGEDNITELLPDDFSGLDLLEELVIKNGKLRTIEDCAFCGLDSLKKINLANNKIDFIDINAFGVFKPVMIYVDLSNNRLDTLAEELLDWDQIEESPRIQQNPFNCDCHLQWMAGHTNLVADSADTPMCASPPKIQGSCPPYLTEKCFVCQGRSSETHTKMWIGATVMLLIAGSLAIAYVVYYKPTRCWFAKIPTPKYAYRNLAADRDDEDNLVSRVPEVPDPVAV